MDINISDATIVALIIAVSEAVKRATGFDHKFIPLLDMALGIMGAWVMSCVTPAGWAYIILRGLILGLSACGLFSAGKNLYEGTHSK